MLRVRQLRWLLRRDVAFLACFPCVAAASEVRSIGARSEPSMTSEETSLRIAYAIGAARHVQQVRSIEKRKREASKIMNNFNL